MVKFRHCMFALLAVTLAWLLFPALPVLMEVAWSIFGLVIGCCRVVISCVVWLAYLIWWIVCCIWWLLTSIMHVVLRLVMLGKTLASYLYFGFASVLTMIARMFRFVYLVMQRVSPPLALVIDWVLWAMGVKMGGFVWLIVSFYKLAWKLFGHTVLLDTMGVSVRVAQLTTKCIVGSLTCSLLLWLPHKLTGCRVLRPSVVGPTLLAGLYVSLRYHNLQENNDLLPQVGGLAILWVLLAALFQATLRQEEQADRNAGQEVRAEIHRMRSAELQTSPVGTPDRNTTERTVVRRRREATPPPLARWRTQTLPVPESQCIITPYKECTICLEGWADVFGAKEVLQCGHVFHATCLQRWKEQRSRQGCQTCPNCRQRISVQRRFLHAMLA